jgi:hypothetical protein
VRLFEEYVEGLRRRKVISGEWQEEESKLKLKEFLEQKEKELPNDEELRQIKRA